MLGNCHLCGNHGVLCNSHILPEFFYASSYNEARQFISVTDHPLHGPRVMQQGLRERLLCAGCESKLSRYESYSASLLRRVDDALALHPDSATVANVDFATFRLFGLSLIWRMHVAESHMFHEVDLGPHAERIRERLVAEDPAEPSSYGFAIAKVTGLELSGDMIISPTKRKFGERRTYQLMARGFEWVFVIAHDAAALQPVFPFVGSTATLHVPVVHRDQRQLFEQIRRAFPRHLGPHRHRES
jgi:hypothetical protein